MKNPGYLIIKNVIILLKALIEFHVPWNVKRGCASASIVTIPPREEDTSGKTIATPWLISRFLNEDLKGVFNNHGKEYLFKFKIG